MNPLRFLHAYWSAVFPPKRRIVRLVRPAWHSSDLMLLECGHRVPMLDYAEAERAVARCDRCLR